MPFLGLWSQRGTEILPTAPVDTIRIPGEGEYATIQRTGGEMIITSSASGAAHLVLNTGSGAEAGTRSVKIQAQGSSKFVVDPTGIGFFAVTPVARQAKAAGPTDLGTVITSFDDLQTKLALYGLLS